jgi:four helix bundle protein
MFVGKIKRFEDMEVWILGRALVTSIYVISKNALFFKDYGLRDQIRRASVSIVSNIAEGSESQSNSSFCRFLYSARASAAEVRTQLYLASDLHYISDSECAQLVTQTESISRQITGFIAYLQKHPNRAKLESGICNLESEILNLESEAS